MSHHDGTKKTGLMRYRTDRLMLSYTDHKTIPKADTPAAQPRCTTFPCRSMWIASMTVLFWQTKLMHFTRTDNSRAAFFF